LLPWQFFSFSFTQASNSVVTNQALITKVYFPRLVMPLASIGVGLLDFSIACAVLVAMMAYYGLTPGLAALTAPLWMALAVLTALGVGLWLSALNVRYRDVRYALPFLTQTWLFATPVAYSSSIVPESWRSLYALNPMVGVVDGFRWALLGTNEPPGLTALVSFGAVSVLLFTGLLYFRRTERTFADTL
jgi:lipopolysaccharide transport system permease protein